MKDSIMILLLVLAILWRPSSCSSNCEQEFRNMIDGLVIPTNENMTTAMNALIEKISAVEDELKEQRSILEAVKSYVNRQEFLCQSPSKPISGLGCITPIIEERNWAEQKKACEVQGLRLLEGIKREHFKALYDAFGHPMFDSGKKTPWVGARGRRWISSSSSSTIPQNVWSRYEPNSDTARDCVIMSTTNKGDKGLFDTSCTDTRRALCQFVY